MHHSKPTDETSAFTLRVRWEESLPCFSQFLFLFFLLVQQTNLSFCLLKENASRARKRIVFSSLYLGNGTLESDLVSCFVTTHHNFCNFLVHESHTLPQSNSCMLHTWSHIYDSSMVDNFLRCNSSWAQWEDHLTWRCTYYWIIAEAQGEIETQGKCFFLHLLSILNKWHCLCFTLQTSEGFSKPYSLLSSMNCWGFNTWNFTYLTIL